VERHRLGEPVDWLRARRLPNMQTFQPWSGIPWSGIALCRVATEDKREVVVPRDAMVSIDTLVRLFRMQAFCVIASVHHP
jgi:hypothetical protein